ncbi:MAG: NIPSNAP family containing protein [Bacteroidetes bacterium]|nr:MAG: NIPSNAP family containing protein [Bacteroidota bacterium]
MTRPALLLLFLISEALMSFGQTPAKQEYYEIKIYRVSQKAQEDRVDAYLKDVYLPALHRSGISKIGVFKPIETDTAFGKLIYVFIPFKTLDQFVQLPEVLGKDKVYTGAGKSFLDAAYNDPPFNRYESILLRAYINMPQFVAPDFTTLPSERIYELRSYESATEAKAVKKREMFNQGGEIALFKSLNFDAVFYAEVLVGSHMPNLMYMITFPDMKSHDEKWKSFGTSDGWKKLSGLEEYKNTVSKANPYLMHPASYSDF